MKESEQNYHDLHTRIENLEREIDSITERNKRVELAKAWETSFARIVVIIGLTYILTSIVFWLIDVERFMLNALIPTIGYTLSTLSLPKIRKYWINSKSKNERSR